MGLGAAADDERRRPGLRSVIDSGGVSRPVERVIVIGAGIAGLTVANALKHAGVECAVVEARERTGGRLHTIDLAGVPIDMGGSWIRSPDRQPAARVRGPSGHPVPCRRPASPTGCLRSRRGPPPVEARGRGQSCTAGRRVPGGAGRAAATARSGCIGRVGDRCVHPWRRPVRSREATGTSSFERDHRSRRRRCARSGIPSAGSGTRLSPSRATSRRPAGGRLSQSRAGACSRARRPSGRRGGGSRPSQMKRCR